MSDLTTTLTIDSTDYQINIDDNTDNHITHKGYMHYNDEFNVYAIISYKTQGGNVLDHTIHQLGTEPTITPISRDAFHDDKIRARIEKELNYTLSDEQLDELAERYREAGADVVNRSRLEKDELYSFLDSDGTISIDSQYTLEGWDIIVEHTLDDLDYHPNDEREIIHTVFTALQDYTPGDNEYTARLETGEIDAWRVRALELYQHSVLANKPQLCKVQALREDGLSNSEIADTLDTHRSTVSHQLNDIDDWLDAADWTTQHVTND